MKTELLEFENKHKLLEPTSTERVATLEAISEYTENFLGNIDTLPAFVNNVSEKAPFIQSINFEEQNTVNEVLKNIRLYIDTPGINPASGGHLGYIPGGGLFYGAVGDYLACITNRYAGVRFASPGAVLLEETVLNWMANLFGYSKNYGGTLTSGGSIANLTAIATARDAINLKAKDYHKAVIYTTQYAHHCLQKSIRILGMDDVQWREIECNNLYQMNVEELEKAINKDLNNGFLPWLLVASAGTTDVGAIDPLQQLSEISKKYNLWFHVDAAYGGFFILTYKGKQLLKGIEQADSIVADPHKGLFIPYGLGAVLIKNKKLLHKTHQYLANYMQDASTEEVDLSPADLSPELSRHFRALRLWLPLKIHGEKPFENYLNEKMQLAAYCYQQLSNLPDVEVFNKPELSVFAFRFLHKELPLDKYNEKIQKAVMNDGRVFISSTRLNNCYVFRIAILSFRTHLSTIETALTVLDKSKKIAEDELYQELRNN